MVLWRIAGQPAPTAKAPFTDLVDAWYRDAIAWAAEQKVVNGRGDGTFDPAGFITREELVTMIWQLRWRGCLRAGPEQLAGCRQAL